MPFFLVSRVSAISFMLFFASQTIILGVTKCSVSQPFFIVMVHAFTKCHADYAIQRFLASLWGIWFSGLQTAFSFTLLLVTDLWSSHISHSLHAQPTSLVAYLLQNDRTVTTNLTDESKLAMPIIITISQVLKKAQRELNTSRMTISCQVLDEQKCHGSIKSLNRNCKTFGRES